MIVQNHFRKLVPLLIILLLALPLLGARAQDAGEAAIDLAAAHYALAPILEAREGWTAQAYNTRNRFGVWRVEFYDADGEELGWAAVNPEADEIYFYESNAGATEVQRLAGEGAVWDFVRESPEVRALTGEGELELYWVDYDGWNDWWGAYLGVEGESLAIIVQFDQPEDPNSLTNPEFVSFYFEVMSYDEWHTAAGSQAVALAFGNPEIAAVVREYEGWRTAVEPLNSTDDGWWTVDFLADDEIIATAVINLETQEVVEYAF